MLAFLEPEGIEAVDAHTVRFTTKNPTPQLPTQIKSRFVHIVPEGATAEDMENHGVGTGPFILGKDFDKGAPFWEVTRNPDYWQPGCPRRSACASPPSWNPSPGPRPSSREIDVATAVDPQLVPLLDANADVDVVKASGGASITLSMGSTRRPSTTFGYARRSRRWWTARPSSTVRSSAWARPVRTARFRPRARSHT